MADAVPISDVAAYVADEALAAAFVAWQRPLARLAYLMCGDVSVAEEVVVEAFAKAVPHVRRGRVDSLGAYLRRAVINEVLSWRRRNDVRRRAAARHGTSEEAVLDDRATDRLSLWPLVGRLPIRQRATIVLRYASGLSVEETAAALGITVGTVKSQTAKALSRLREWLEESDVDQ